MNSTASNAWMPTGRHEINIGTSLVRALKARKGGPVKSSGKAKPDREFYSFRYNFKPESVDPTKPGSIEIKKAKEEGGPSSVNVVRPSTQNDYGVNYVGQERPTREVDCVLIYDEELQTFTLEKIESAVTLQHDPRTVHAPRHANSPVPPAPQRPSATPVREVVREEEEESEGEIPEPAKTKPPSRLNAAAMQPKVKPTPPVAQPAPRSLPPSLPPKPVTPTIPPKPAPAAVPAKPAPAAVPAKPAQSAAPPKPRPRPIGASTLQAAVKGPNKRELPADAEETPTSAPTPRRTVQPPPFKKAKVVPEKKKEPVALALPGAGASSALALPSSSSASTSAHPPSLSLPTSSSFVTLPPAPTPAAAAVAIPAPEATVAAVTDSDEEEWDEVQPTIAPAPAPTSAFAAALTSASPSTSAFAAALTAAPVIVMEEIDEPSAFTPPAGDDGEGVEIDMAAFEEELMEQLEDPEADAEGDADVDEDDFLAGAMSPVVERQPVSLSAYAGGGPDFGDEDDFSSSDSSDED